MNKEKVLHPTDQELIQQFPKQPWREPLQVTNITRGQVRLVCRFCAARHGLRGSELTEKGFRTLKLFQKHLEEEHPL